MMKETLVFCVTFDLNFMTLHLLSILFTACIISDHIFLSVIF